MQNLVCITIDTTLILFTQKTAIIRRPYLPLYFQCYSITYKVHIALQFFKILIDLNFQYFGENRYFVSYKDCLFIV